MAIVRQSLAAANDVCGLPRELRRSSAAVATSREGHRSPRSGPALPRPRQGPACPPRPADRSPVGPTPGCPKTDDAQKRKPGVPGHETSREVPKMLLRPGMAEKRGACIGIGDLNPRSQMRIAWQRLNRRGRISRIAKVVDPLGIARVCAGVHASRRGRLVCLVWSVSYCRLRGPQ